ncbi:MAG: hypothetical protein ACWA5L_05655 [bacterium]
MSNLTLKTKLLGASAAIALILSGCGGDKNKQQEMDANGTSTEVTKVTGGGTNPVDKKFVYKEGKEIDTAAFFASIAEEDEAPVKFASSEFDKSIGAQVLTDVVMSEDGDTMNIGRVELYGLNTDYIARLENDEISDTKEQVFRKVRLFDLSMTPEADDDESVSIKIGAIEFDNLKMGGFDPEEFEGDDSDDKDGKEFAAFMNGVEFGGVNARDITFDVSLDGEGLFKGGLGDLRFGGFGGGDIGAVTIKNLDYNMKMSEDMRAEALSDPDLKMIANTPLKNLIAPESQSFMIEKMSWDGMNFKGLLGYLEKGEEPPVTATDLISFGKMEFHNMKSKMNGKEYSESKFSKMDPIEFAWLVPTRIASSGDGKANLTALVPDDQPEILAMFKEHGLDKLSSDSNFLWEYDDKTGKATLVSESKMKNFADIDFNITLSEAPLETLYNAAKAEDEMAFMNITLDGFTLKVADDSLLDVVFAVAAMQLDQDAEQLRAGMPMLIGMGSQQLTAMNPAFGGYATAVSDWIVDGGTLEITMAPEQPVSFGALAMSSQMSPQTIPDVLGLKVTHSK